MGPAEARPSEAGSRRERDGDKYHGGLALTARVVDAGEEEKHLREDHKLARPNYSGEKRRKDLAKKAKKEEKRLRKLQAKENPTSEDAEMAEPGDAGEETKDEG
jgi:hypothetical protein